MITKRKDKYFAAQIVRHGLGYPCGTVGVVLQLVNKAGIGYTFAFKMVDSLDPTQSHEYVPVRKKDFREIKRVRRNDGKIKKKRQGS